MLKVLFGFNETYQELKKIERNNEIVNMKLLACENLIWSH